MNGDRLIRIAAAGVVAAVAAFAAVVSYSHIYDLGRGHGGSVLAARLLPLSVDGLILAMSLVMLHEARNGRPAPVLARCMLALGVAATLAANVAYGAAYGAVGAVIWAWPAVAFVGAVEVDLLLVRSARGAPAPAAVPAALANGHSAPEGGQEAAERYAAELARGEIPSVRRVRREMHLGQPRAQQVHAYLSALART
jgi:Protein of unknown function (DUF2637)